MLTARPAHTRATRVDDGREGGVTLIELLVAMVLLLVIGGMVTRGLVDGLVHSQEGDATQQATTNTNVLVEQLGDDVRSMSMSETSPELRNYDLPKLRELVLTGAGLNDLVIANPQELEFVADVVGPESTGNAKFGTGPECVRYYVAPDKSVHRELRSFDETACADTTPFADSTVLPPPPANSKAPVSTLEFSYRSRYNNQPAKNPLNPDDCQDAGPVPEITTSQARGFVVSIGLDMRAYAPRADVVGTAELTTDVSMRARLSHDYQYALGCSY